MRKERNNAEPRERLLMETKHAMTRGLVERMCTSRIVFNMYFRRYKHRSGGRTNAF